MNHKPNPKNLAKRQKDYDNLSGTHKVNGKVVQGVDPRAFHRPGSNKK